MATSDELFAQYQEADRRLAGARSPQSPYRNWWYNEYFDWVALGLLAAAYVAFCIFR